MMTEEEKEARRTSVVVMSKILQGIQCSDDELFIAQCALKWDPTIASEAAARVSEVHAIMRDRIAKN
jgi:hypothetical protein